MLRATLQEMLDRVNVARNVGRNISPCVRAIIFYLSFSVVCAFQFPVTTFKIRVSSVIEKLADQVCKEYFNPR